MNVFDTDLGADLVLCAALGSMALGSMMMLAGAMMRWRLVRQRA